MIKVTVDNKPTGKDYPYIGVGKDTGAVVFFTSRGTGVCLEEGSSQHLSKGKYPVGVTYEYFTEAAFKRVSSVTIYNE